MEFDNLTEEEKAKLWELWKAMKSKEAKEEQKAVITREKTEEKPKPLYKAYWPLGEGQGISLTLWENSLQLERRVRDENKNWKTEQQIVLARQILEKLFIRLPYLFKLMKDEREY
jgi:hypothetical protein